MRALLAFLLLSLAFAGCLDDDPAPEGSETETPVVRQQMPDEDPDKTETHKARSGILEKSALSTITGVWNKQPKNSTAAIEA